MRVGGFLFATIPSVGDTKAKNNISGNKNEYLIKSEIAQQEGAVIFATDIDGDFLEQFDMFSVKDYGFFERKSLSRDINFSENYVVAEKK